jgi:hypothetical protein
MTADQAYEGVKHFVYDVDFQKRNFNTENLLESLAAAIQLWLRVRQRKYDLGTLMKCVGKALIHHLPESQHPVMILCCCGGP